MKHTPKFKNKKEEIRNQTRLESGKKKRNFVNKRKLAFEVNEKKFHVKKEIVEFKLLDEKNSLLKIDKSQPDVDKFVDVKKRIENFEVLKQENSSKGQNNPEKKFTSPNIARLSIVPFSGGRVSPLTSRQNLRPPNLQKTVLHTSTGNEELNIGCARGLVIINSPLIPLHRREIVPPRGDKKVQDQGRAKERDQWETRIGTGLLGPDEWDLAKSDGLVSSNLYTEDIYVNR